MADSPRPGQPDGQPGEPDYRFTLANERTFLAYERTAIGLIAAGLAVLQFLDIGASAALLSLLLLTAGTVAALGGLIRYRAVDRAIRSGGALPAGRVAQGLAVFVACCAVVALGGAVVSLLR